jgi:hypothetical protein
MLPRARLNHYLEWFLERDELNDDDAGNGADAALRTMADHPCPLPLYSIYNTFALIFAPAHLCGAVKIVEF